MNNSLGAKLTLLVMAASACAAYLAAAAAWARRDVWVPIDAAAAAIVIAALLLLAAAIRRTQGDATMLRDAVDALGDGLVVYDRNDRLVLTNRKYRELHKATSLAAVRGASFEEIIRAAVASGEVPPIGRDLDAVVDERLRQHRSPGGSVDRPNGTRWLRISERKTITGGTVGIHADISELKRAQSAAEAAEARMADFAATASDWLWEADTAGCLVFLSENFFLATGIPVAARIGAPRLDVTRSLDPDNPTWDDHLARLAARQPFRDFVMRVVTPKGARHLSVSGVPRYDAAGEFLGYRGTTRDVTAEVEATQALARQTETLLQLVENLPISVSLVGPDGRYRALNRKFLEEFGLESGALTVGSRFEDFVRHAARMGDYGAGEIETLVQNRLARLQLRTVEHFEHVRPNGHVIQVSVVPLAAGGFVTSRIDVTEARQREQALRAAHARLQQQAAEIAATAEQLRTANAARSHFLANMSHELRTPLNAILGFSEILRDAVFGPLERRYVDYAQDIHRSGIILLRLVNDLLDLARIDAGKFELRDEDVDLDAIVAETCRLVSEKARAGGVSLATAMPDRLPLVTADHIRMKQILLNLLSNAVKFTLPGGTVTVSVDDGPAGLTIKIADTGIGMRPEDIPAALEPFRQVDSSYARRHQGAGLGLPIAKSLAELHGGRLALESTPGHGTTVSVWLPPDRCKDRARASRASEAG